tara:strand:- start:477 stop:1244 length:768 start_codon:yes stop_codon:yes gene_type:complete
MAIETSKLGGNKRIDITAICRLDVNSLQRRVREIGLLVQNEWRNKARSSLNTTATDYINNIQLEFINNSVSATCEVVLYGTIPNMMEQGMGPGGVGSTGPYDLRKFVLKGRQYVDIPFDRTGADIQNFGYASKPFSLTKQGVHMSGVGAEAYAKMMAPDERMQANMARKMRNAPNFVHDPFSGRTLVQEPHAADPLAGMIKHKATYAKTKGATFTSFRRMSAKGKPWVHPGIVPRKLAQKIDFGRCISAAFSIAI